MFRWRALNESDCYLQIALNVYTAIIVEENTELTLETDPFYPTIAPPPQICPNINVWATCLNIVNTHF